MWILTSCSLNAPRRSSLRIVHLSRFLEFRPGTLPSLLQKVVEIQPPRKHRQFAAGAARPCLGRTVPIQFNAVLVRIPQVERFTDTMIGGAVERDACPHHAAQNVGESGARRVHDGVVVESRRTWGTVTIPSTSSHMGLVWVNSPFSTGLGRLRKTPAAVMLSAIDFSGFVVGRNAAKNGKTKCLPAVTTKNCFSESWQKSTL
jgi:hypothetical protein